MGIKPISSSSLCGQVDVSDAKKTAEAFLKIASVYKEDNNDVKNAVLESVGEFFVWITSCYLSVLCIACFVGLSSVAENIIISYQSQNVFNGLVFFY